MTELENKLISEIQSLNTKFDNLLELFRQSGGNMSVMPFSDKTFGEWLIEWYNKYKVPKGLKPSYLKRIRYDIDKYLMRDLGEKRLSDLDGTMLQDYINAIDAANLRKKLSLIINESLNKAVALRLMAYNPFAAVDLPKSKTRHYRPLEFDEQYALLKAVNVEKYTAVLWVLCCTGMRIGELLALDFKKDIDYYGRIIHVRRDIDILTGQLNDTPKTETSIRKIPFLPTLEKYLKVLAVTPLTYNGVRLFFKRKYESLGFEKLNLHSFRHTFISLCYMAGIPEKVIQIMAGHSDINLTLNIYTHVLKRGNSRFFEYIKRLKKEVEFR
ncbi:MAG: site-specific integrase [Clostridia bacterium]|nr:site-specific integrase [Clostridia bacterium]